MTRKMGLREAILVALCLCFVLDVGFAARNGGNSGGNGRCPAGPNAEKVAAKEEARWSIFDQLSTAEIWDVVNFMMNDMGVFHDGNKTIKEKDFPTIKGPNHLVSVRLIDPPKEEALAYLDGKGKRPKRYARATVVRTEAEPKDVMEYKVGPLPLPKDKRPKKAVEKLVKRKGPSPRKGVTVEELLKDGEVPFAKRPFHKYQTFWLEQQLARAIYKMKEVLKDSLGVCYGHDDSTPKKRKETAKECRFDDMYWLETSAIDDDHNRRITGIHWFFMPKDTGGEEFELHSAPLHFKIDETGIDDGEWDIFDIEYCHQGPFPSIEEFLEQYESGNVVKCVAATWKDKDYDPYWSQTTDREKDRKGSKRASPRTFEPQGSRFEVHRKTPGGGEFFEYLGWEGHVALRQDTGLAFHDIRFKGERIIYELSLQELYVAYSGYSLPGQTTYFDSYYGIGIWSFPMKRGVDCPESALYLSSAQLGWKAEVKLQPDLICIFEEDGQTTEWRHTHENGVDGPRLDALRRSSLVVRSIATVGNYDYIFDVKFKLDASIEVDIKMAGYMDTIFFDPKGQTLKDTPFGARVHKHTFATLHDHLSNWKIDLDVLGTDNRVKRQEVKSGTWEEALKSVDSDAKRPGWHRADILKYLEYTDMEEEFGTNKKDDNGMYIFQKERELNRWGNTRGYAIVQGETTSQLLPYNHPFTKPMAWTKYNLAVTRQKDSEHNSHAAMYDYNVLSNPLVSFDTYLDGERIVDEDLVAWLTMGVQHVPRSEDVPVISNFGTNFHIKPWNYFDGLVSMDVAENNDFNTCTPQVGEDFEYAWAWAKS